MADEQRSVYWPIMIAACIGALGTVAAAVLERVDVGAMVSGGGSPPIRPHRTAPPTRSGDVSPTLPADWIDARGRYYSVRQSGSALGLIAFDGGQRALEKDRVRLTGDGTFDGHKAQWSWAGDKARNPETCVGRASASAMTVRCARDDGGDPSNCASWSAELAAARVAGARRGAWMMERLRAPCAFW